MCGEVRTVFVQGRREDVVMQQVEVRREELAIHLGQEVSPGDPPRPSPSASPTSS